MLNPATHQETRPANTPAWPDLASGPPSKLAWSNVSTTSDLAGDPWQGADSMHARYYSPMTGRFLAVDPGRDSEAAKPQSWNLYSYVRGNPVNAVDLTGRLTELLVGLRTSDNIFGHIAIAVNGRVYSWGTGWVGGRAGDWGVDKGAYLAAQNGSRATEVMTLNVSSADEVKLVEGLEANNPKAPGAPPYAAMTNSCVTKSEIALESAGILKNEPGPVVVSGSGALMQRGAPVSHTPGSLADQVKSQQLVTRVEVVGTPTKTTWLGSLFNTVSKFFRRTD